ncbi:MAG: DUF3000 domain-containing protein [Actinomycetia bacterium]|jgi:hypothetical protein|nr:DUF3000 domain-containing protein [Actinomycetes bacterium]
MSLREPDEAPEQFRRALEALRATRLRPEIALEETAAPQRLAPHAVALSADVVGEDDEELATGRFVLLHDPAGHETWQGHFRVVTFVRAELELELAADPVLPSVGWSWLIEALETRQVPYAAISGTVTRVTSEAFGSMGDREPTAEVEMRASWTALDSRLGPHLQAWADVLATAAGLPPLAAGVVALPRSRGRRAH